MAYNTEAGGVWTLFDTSANFQPISQFLGFADISKTTLPHNGYEHWIRTYDDASGFYTIDVFYPIKKRLGRYIDIYLKINSQLIKVKWRHGDVGFCSGILCDLLEMLDKAPETLRHKNELLYYLNSLADEYRETSRITTR